MTVAAAVAGPSTRPASPGHQHWQRGVALAREGRLADAAAALDKAIKKAPNESLYWLNLASVRRRQRLTDDALRCAQRAFELDRRNLLACHLWAELLRNQNRSAAALKVLKALDPAVERDAQHSLLEGTLQMALGQWQDAAMSFLNVLARKPAHIEAYQQLGFAFANLGRHADASECFRTVAILEPQIGSAVYSAHYSAWACDWKSVAEDMPRLAEAMARIGEGGATPGYSPFCLLSLNDDAAMHKRAASVSAAHLAREARNGQFDQAWVAPDPGPAGYPQVLAAPRCRIGFVSADFRMHATSILLVQTLERLDRERFEVILYSHGKDDDSALRRRLVDAVDRFVDCREMSTAEQAAQIRADGVAILVDMSGFTASSRLAVFALRPAPIQVLWLAYPSTTGSDFIDYVIGDPILTPLAHADDFSEKIAQLPVCYEPTDEQREHPATSTRAENGLPEGAFVYACFNQSYKITDEVYTRWCRILQQVENSVLWLLVPQEHIQATLRQRAAERGVDPARLVFAPFVNPTEHLARLPLADLFLDTFPYGAHTTCSDALWMGLPVLTQVGRSFSARVAASLLAAVDLAELAVDDAVEYERLAIEFANDRAALQRCRDQLSERRMQLALFDNRRFTAEIGELFSRMVERWSRGQAPEALPAQPLTSLPAQPQQR